MLTFETSRPQGDPAGAEQPGQSIQPLQALQTAQPEQMSQPTQLRQLTGMAAAAPVQLEQTSQPMQLRQVSGVAAAAAPVQVVRASPAAGSVGSVPRQLQLGSQSYGLLVDPATGQQVYVPPDCPNQVTLVEGVDRIDPLMVHSLLQEQMCLLVDVRGDDRVSGLIEAAVHVPAIHKVPFLSRVPELVREWADEPLVVFTCQYSAHRAPQCANWYRQQASPSQQVAILSGGFRGWESCKLPVQALSSAAVGQTADGEALQLGSQIIKIASIHSNGSLAAVPAQAAPAALGADAGAVAAVH